MVKLLKEPLLHFLLIGAGLFALYAGLNPNANLPDQQLVIKQGQINHLVQRFERVWMREPTEQELQQLIEDFVIEEIYYREAQALGIDQDDPVIRRRLRQKMEVYSDTLATTLAPTDEQLTQYLNKHPEKFKTDNRYSFEQIYVNTDRPTQELQQFINAIAINLQQSKPAAGDSTLLADRYLMIRSSELERTFGQGFAQRLDTLPLQQWHGPIESGLGVHFIKLTTRQAGELPSLPAARASVEHEWRFDQAQQIEKEMRDKLLAKYDVVIDSDEKL